MEPEPTHACMQADVASALAAILLFAHGCNFDLEVEGDVSVPGKKASPLQGPWLLAQVIHIPFHHKATLCIPERLYSHPKFNFSLFC